MCTSGKLINYSFRLQLLFKERRCGEIIFTDLQQKLSERFGDAIWMIPAVSVRQSQNGHCNCRSSIRTVKEYPTGQSGLYRRYSIVRKYECQ